MKKMAFLGLMLGSLVAFTQVAGADTTAKSKSLIFGFDNFVLGGFSDMAPSFPLFGIGKQVGVGMRYFISDGTALRPAIGFGYNKEEIELDPLNKANTTDTNEQTTDMDWSFSLAYEKHMKAAAKVSPYCGLGLGYLPSSSKFEPVQTVPATAGALVSSKSTTTSFMGFGLLGVNWSFMDNISLGGEYRLGFTSSSEKSEDEVTGGPNTEDKTTNTGVGISSGSLYLSFNF